MTPERWCRVKKIFEAALQQQGSARVGFRGPSGDR